MSNDKEEKRGRGQRENDRERERQRERVERGEREINREPKILLEYTIE